MKKICVIGSINMDMVVENKKFVKPGETVTGLDFFTTFGGKGANQAVACARLGGEVSFVGIVGDDIYGKECKDNLNKNNIDVISVATRGKQGVALIEIEESGENRITVVPGSNGLIDKAFVDENMSFILEHDIFLLQNEIPIDTNYYLIEMLAANNKITILDPAPADGIELECIKGVTYITPNNSELETLTDETDALAGVEKMQNYGMFTVLKSGKNGAYILQDGELVNFPAANYGNCADTTGAGDTFNGAFAFALAKGYDLRAAIALANKAAGFSITKKGAQTGMPTLEDIEMN